MNRLRATFEGQVARCVALGVVCWMAAIGIACGPHDPSYRTCVTTPYTNDPGEPIHTEQLGYNRHTTCDRR